MLLVALALLIVGLVTSTSSWLAGSLVASVLAALLLVVERLVQRRRSPSAAAGASAADSSAAGASDTGASGDDDAPAPLTDPDPPAIDPDHPDAVWVVDGRPRYHTRDCATVASLQSEPVPRDQALEDGFVACSLCEPGTRPVPTSTG